MHPITLIVLLGLTAGVANVAGGALLSHREWEQRYLKYFMALGAGFMLATSITEMVPASVNIEGGEHAGFLVLLGYLIIHFCEHVVSGHFHFGAETHHDEFLNHHKSTTVLLGMVIHAFFDGIAIASGFLVSNWLGWIVFLAIVLHKIPEGFTVSSVMLASGRSTVRAFGASIVLGVANRARRADYGGDPSRRRNRTARLCRSDNLRGRLRHCAGSQPRAWYPHAAAALCRCRYALRA